MKRANDGQSGQCAVRGVQIATNVHKAAVVTRKDGHQDDAVGVGIGEGKMGNWLLAVGSDVGF